MANEQSRWAAAVRVPSVLLWLVAAGGGGYGGYLFTLGFAEASSAPQQAAAATIALVYAIIPYVVARAWDELTRSR